MKQASAVLIKLLNTAERIYRADLFTFRLISGVIIRYTSLDIDLNIGGNIYTSFPIKKGTLSQSRGLSVDDLDVNINYNPQDIVYGGITMKQAMRNGDFDNAELSVDKVFSDQEFSYGLVIPADYVLPDWFVGRVDIDSAGIISATLKIKSKTELLNQQLPRNLFSPSCLNTLYDGSCGVNRAAYTVEGTVMAGSNLISVVTNLTQPDEYFNIGVIGFDTGPNTGVRRSVKQFTNGVIYPIIPFPYIPAVGDQYRVYPGCTRDMTTCKNKFHNLIKFKAQPFIPVPEAVT